MADAPENMEQTPETSPPDDSQALGVPVEEEPMEIEAPRRAASAEFIVDSEAGSQVLLREAMDPANQSLREALRLSFRVLQLVMLVLIVLFVVSGFQKVENGQSGVMLGWGKIIAVDGREALEPGLKFSKWPYPVGEFILFDDRNRISDVGNAFWPAFSPGQTFDQAVERANTSNYLRPGKDGLLLTRDGDIAHMKLRAEYEIVSPVKFVHCVESNLQDASKLDSDKLVKLAMRRAAVHAVAKKSLSELVDFSDDDKVEMEREAQTLLTDIGSGIRIADLTLPEEPTPALAIRKSYGDLQQARADAEKQMVDARQASQKTLIDAAGKGYQQVLDLVEQYENALDLEETELAEQLLTRINDWFEGAEPGGQVSQIIYFAKSYRSTIESTVGSEARRFNSLLPAYRDKPNVVVARLWSQAYRNVLVRGDAERFFVPQNIGSMSLLITGYDEIRQYRRRKALDSKEARSKAAGLDFSSRYRDRAGDMRMSGPGRILDAQGKGLGESSR